MYNKIYAALLYYYSKIDDVIIPYLYKYMYLTRHFPFPTVTTYQAIAIMILENGMNGYFMNLFMELVVE